MTQRSRASLLTRDNAWLVPTGLYALGFLLWLPSAHAVATSDEASYLGQAALFARGQLEASLPALGGGEPVSEPVSDYPVGTSLLAAPFVALGGLSWGRLPSLVSLLGATALTAWVLRRRGKDPRYALLVLGYLPSLVLGRVTMSDCPSVLIVAGFLALLEHGSVRSLGFAGLVAGAALLFRETNLVIMGPFLAGVFVRRDPGRASLAVGLGMGVAARLGSSWFLFGDPLFAKSSYPFSLAAIPQNLVLYVLALLVLVPGGLVVAARYRGPRAPELLTAVFGCAVFFLVYSYGGAESGTLRRLIVAPRYFAPLTPLVAQAWAAMVTDDRWESMREWAMRIGIVGLSCAAFGVHPFLSRWEGEQARVVARIDEAVPEGTVVVTQPSSTAKYLAVVFGARTVVDYQALDDATWAALSQAHPTFFVVLYHRTDSDYHRARWEEASDWLHALEARCSVESLGSEPTPAEEVGIWQVRCAG
ncbi:MAG: hypothetical protein J0L92_06540 [Deltaproteobacteria bacterium]|nr:hypothetical protein [Deltaproteobacteria bacterium]